MSQAKPIRMAHNRKPARPTKMGITTPTALSNEQIDAVAGLFEAAAAIIKHSNQEECIHFLKDASELEYGEAQTGEALRRAPTASELLSKTQTDAALVETTPPIATMGLRSRKPQPVMSQREIAEGVAALTRHR